MSHQTKKQTESEPLTHDPPPFFPSQPEKKSIYSRPWTWNERQERFQCVCGSVPSGDPGGEGRPPVAREARAPVVEASGGGEGGADLGHGEADRHGEGAGDEPAEGHGGRPSEVEAGVVQRGDPRQHRDDGEGEGEVGQQSTHAG